MHAGCRSASVENHLGHGTKKSALILLPVTSGAKIKVARKGEEHKYTVQREIEQQARRGIGGERRLRENFPSTSTDERYV